MKMFLRRLLVRATSSIETIPLGASVTFIHGPIGQGKSSVARLIDFCLGGDLERTPAIQSEFLAAELSLRLGSFDCLLERGSHDTESVRVTWSGGAYADGSINAPLVASPDVLLPEATVHNLSDLLFHLCDVEPIKVRSRMRDPDSPLIRLSFRDLWRFCYLSQEHLDSSFFRFEDPFRGRKSQDALRFVTGLHSERLSALDDELLRVLDDQRGKREAAEQIRAFMRRFELGTEMEVVAQLATVREQLRVATERRSQLEAIRTTQIHPTDELRAQLRTLSSRVSALQEAVRDATAAIDEQRALRAEFITAKTKAVRSEQAHGVLSGVSYLRCPECGSELSDRASSQVACKLCLSPTTATGYLSSSQLEALRRDLNQRVDELDSALQRRQNELARTQRALEASQRQKVLLDRQLQDELARYDSAFVESIRAIEREVATLTERSTALLQLQRMPQAIDDIQQQAGELQGKVDLLRGQLLEEKQRLQSADANISALRGEFKRMLLAVHFPGVTETDDVAIDSRDWKPQVVHAQQSWSFWDTGSGGKKTLFNVCFALAVHSVARERGLPLPTVLIVDSPTKNISKDLDSEVVRALYGEIYRLAGMGGVQIVLIDSDFIAPPLDLEGVEVRRMTGEPEAPSLFPHYEGP